MIQGWNERSVNDGGDFCLLWLDIGLDPKEIRDEIPTVNLTKNFASRRQSWRDSRQDRAKIFATVNLLLSKNLARFWPPGFLLPGKNLGEIES